MSTLVTILHVLVCLFLMLTVLLQSGKGGGMGAAFGGGGGGGTVFGGSGAGGFLRKLTVACAAIFMITSMSLAYIASNTGADALKRFSVQQRQAAEVREQARQEALQGVVSGEDDTTPDQGAAGETGAAGTEGGSPEAMDETTDEAAGTEPEAAAPAVEGAADTAEQAAGQADDTASPQ